MRRPRFRSAVLIGSAIALAIALLAVLLVVESRAGSQENAAAQADTVVPPGVAVDVRDFGARGDGRTDDTDALQAAISAGIGKPTGGAGNPRRILYLPTGTYLVSRPLEWRTATGEWAAGLTLQGQNRDGTTIRLVDRAAGFSNPTRPAPVIRTASQNANGPDGSGNQAFGNFVFDLTISVGSGNPGADGLDFLSNNRGAVRDVTVRADPDSGRAGVAMTRRWPGPCLFEDLRIVGFEHGVVIGQSEYSVTFDGLQLNGQRSSGIDNTANVVTVRRMTAQAITGPVVRNLPGGFVPGLVTVTDSDLTGTSPTFPAVDNDGSAYLLRVRTTGFAGPVRDRGRLVSTSSDVAEWSSAPLPAVDAGDAPAMEAPPFPVGSAAPLEAWAGAASFGAVADDDSDDTAAIQRALDSGKPVVYLRPGTYIVNSSLTIPPTVEEIAGFDAVLDATRGALRSSSTASVLVVPDGSAEPLVVSQLSFQASPGVHDVERPGSRPIHLRDVHLSGQPFRGGPGQVFLSDVEGGRGWTFTPGQEVWARQLNAEQRAPAKISNRGARLWVLGLKTESAGTVIVSEAGASTEVLGGLLYPVEPVPPDQPAFVGDQSRQRLGFATSANDATRSYSTLVADGGRVVLRRGDTSTRGQGVGVPLFRVG